MQFKHRPILALLLVLILAVSCLSGCTKTPPEPAVPDTQTDFGNQTDPNANTGSDEPTGPVRVTNVREFLDAIRPGAEIVLAPGTYELNASLEPIYAEGTASGGTVRYGDYVRIGYTGNGYDLLLADLNDVTIRGESDNRADTRIVSSDMVATVLRFSGCENIILSDFTTGHSVPAGGCEGDVIGLVSCKNFTCYNLDIFGCGVFGVNANSGGVESLAFRNCLFRDCTGGAFWFQEFDSIVSFFQCTFEGPLSYLTFLNYPKASFQFTDCSFTECDQTNWTSPSNFIHKRSSFNGVSFSTENPIYPNDRFDPRELKPASIGIDELNGMVWDAFMESFEMSFTELPRTDGNHHLESLSFRFNADGTGLKVTRSPYYGVAEDSFTWSLSSDNTVQVMIDDNPYPFLLVPKQMDRNGTKELILELQEEEGAFWLSRHHTVTVSSIPELLEAIRPGAKITLKAGTYDLTNELTGILAGSDVWQSTNGMATVRKSETGPVLEINGCEGLALIGEAEDRTKTVLLGSDTGAPLLSIFAANDLKLERLSIGIPNASDPNSVLITFQNFSTASINDCDLFGSSVAIRSENARLSITLSDCTIRDCAQHPFSFTGCDGKVTFQNTSLIDSAGGGFVKACSNLRLWFYSCHFGVAETARFWLGSDDNTTSNGECTFSETTAYPNGDDRAFDPDGLEILPYSPLFLSDTVWEGFLYRLIDDWQFQWTASILLPYTIAESGREISSKILFAYDGTGQLYLPGRDDPYPFKWKQDSENIALVDVAGDYFGFSVRSDPHASGRDHMLYAVLGAEGMGIWFVPQR